MGNRLYPRQYPPLPVKTVTEATIALFPASTKTLSKTSTKPKPTCPLEMQPSSCESSTSVFFLNSLSHNYLKIGDFQDKSDKQNTPTPQVKRITDATMNSLSNFLCQFLNLLDLIYLNGNIPFVKEKNRILKKMANMPEA